MINLALKTIYHMLNFPVEAFHISNLTDLLYAALNALRLVC